MATQEEIRKKISAPLSSDPGIRQRQKVERKALILKSKGFKPKRKAQVIKPKPKAEKPKEKARGGIFGVIDKLRERGKL